MALCVSYLNDFSMFELWVAACIVRSNSHCDGCNGACVVFNILCIMAGMSRSRRFCISFAMFSARQFCLTLCICI